MVNGWWSEPGIFVCSISNAVNRLFELKRYPELANTLTDLNEKIRYKSTN